MTWTDNDTFRLRQDGQYNGSPQNILANQAADEIVRLRTVLEEIAAGSDEHWCAATARAALGVDEP